MRRAVLAALLCATLPISLGCQSGRPLARMRDTTGALLRGAVANMHDNHAYSQASPSRRFDIEDTPGLTSESWETASRDYPGALPASGE